MGCENLATKSDIAALSARIDSAEGRIVGEIRGSSRAISLQISQSTTTIIGKCQEILNAVLYLENGISEVKSQIIVLIGIVTNLVSVIGVLQTTIIARIDTLFGLIASLSALIENVLNEIALLYSTIKEINALLSSINGNVLSLRSLIQNDIAISSEALALTSSVKNDTTQLITTVRVISDTQIVQNTNLSPVFNSPLFRIGGGGSGALIEVLSPQLNAILQLCLQINNNLGNGQGATDEVKKLTNTKLKLKEVNCINCEEKKDTSDPCTAKEKETGAEVKEKEVLGVNEALIEIDNKLSVILTDDCKPKNKIEKYVQVVLDGLPRKSKVYFGDSENQTVVFAGWVKFHATYENGSGAGVDFGIGLEQPIRRIVEFFKIPDYCSGYTVQAMNESRLRHRLVLVQNGKILTDLLQPSA